MVSAYEDHEHVYDRLRVKPGVVLIRGGGIVSSRVLQRLMDDRAKYHLSTDIVHLFRTYISSSHGPNQWMRRKGGNGFAYQGFNYPKSVWGGQLKAKMRRLEGEQRATEYKLMGGTNTPWRRNWQRQMNQGRAEGWYRVMAGTVEEMKVRDDGMVISMVKTGQGPAEVAADFVIDCTGLEADISEHRVLADLLEHSGAGRNPVGRLDVERTFELRGTGSAPGVIYASGAATLGGYFPGRGHLPRPADRRPGDHRRPGSSWILPRRSGRAVRLSSGCAGRLTGSRDPPMMPVTPDRDPIGDRCWHGSYLEWPHTDQDFPARRGRRPHHR